MPGITAPLYIPRLPIAVSSSSPDPENAFSRSHSAHSFESRSVFELKSVSCNAYVSSLDEMTANTVARLLVSFLLSLYRCPLRSRFGAIFSRLDMLSRRVRPGSALPFVSPEWSVTSSSPGKSRQLSRSIRDTRLAGALLFLRFLLARETRLLRDGFCLSRRTLRCDVDRLRVLADRLRSIRFRLDALGFLTFACLERVLVPLRFLLTAGRERLTRLRVDVGLPLVFFFIQHSTPTRVCRVASAGNEKGPQCRLRPSLGSD
jgi:hypothetical protein